MIIALSARLQGVRQTVGSLAKRVGTSLHVQPSRVPNTPPTEIIEASVSRQTRIRNNEISKYHQFLQEPDGQMVAQAIDEEQSARLERALDHIKVATTDLEITGKDVPWLLTYSKLIEYTEKPR